MELLGEERKSGKGKLLTVFTPTYNRGYVLTQLYNSLKNQTSKNFVWSIVDDGSTDNTKELVEGFVKENEIEIEYAYQQNSGKMQAHNLGVEKCTTKLFTCIDSDDFLTNDAVETIEKTVCERKIFEKENVCGIVAYRGKDKDTALGNSFPENVKEGTLTELYEKGLSGDTTLVFKSEVIRRYSFPKINNEKFITESYVYERIDCEYVYAVLPKVLTICEYRTDGLTQNGDEVIFKNPCGYVAYNLQRAILNKGLKAKIKAYVCANCFRGKVKGVTLSVKVKNRFLYNVTYPFGKILYLLKKQKMKRKKEKEKRENSEKV